MRIRFARFKEVNTVISRLQRLLPRWKSPSGRAPNDTKHHRLLADLQQMTGPVRGKRVLEIGSDSNARFLELAVEKGAACAVGVNPSVREERHSDRIELLRLDARKTRFEADSFDVIASVAVFEHVFSLDEVLAEAFRVLKPGGLLYTEFGPIWSAAWGHHLWFYYNGGVVDWRTHKLPPYAHLLMTREELETWSIARFGDSVLANKICQFVYDSPDQNRLFFSDYMHAFEQSQFEIVFACGSPDVPHPKGTPEVDVPETFSELRRRYPDKSGFGSHIISVLLRKPPRNA